ncbi:LOW QUALITY PROTEIN: uncharacterized protein CXorf49 homolog [Neofelis nebulosa]|uniref:LOW QUALITY PROTEIN: uncharacterized protein CXorf49 homolog n=1 Tax=Neofelis nebulosa TaxID=61452 RepID=UPI002729F702|nr:LOW QUALITY PROTEIN: uncharacterized protein CXorf49 homolog [Neofelis nebulosa]
MSASDEVSICGAGFGEEGGEQAGVRPASPGAPRGPPGLGVDLGPPPSGEGEGEGGVPDPEGFEFEREVTETGEPVFWDLVGRPSSPTDHTGDALDCASHLADEAVAAIVQQLTNQDGLGVRRNPYPEGYVVEAGPPGRGALALGRRESQPPAAALLRLGGPEGGPAWANPERGTKSRSNVAAVDRQRPSAESPGELLSDSESADEFSEIQLMRVSIYAKGGGQLKPNSPEDPWDTPRHSKFDVRENFLHMLGSFLSSAPRGLTSVVESQAVGELDISSSRKIQSVVRGKGGNRPSYPRSAAAGSLPRDTPKKKVAQKKKSPGGTSNVALGRMFPSWGQRVSAAPLEPATFPPVTGVPLLGRSKRYSLVPPGTKQSKHTPAGKKSVARRTRKAEPVVAGEDNDSNRDAVPKLSAHRPEPSCPFMHREASSRGDLNPRAPQFRGSSQPLAPSQGDVMPREPGPSGECCRLHRSAGETGSGGPPLPLPVALRRVEAQLCSLPPLCLLLQREVDNLKEQLAALQSLTDQFQTL